MDLIIGFLVIVVLALFAAAGSRSNVRTESGKTLEVKSLDSIPKFKKKWTAIENDKCVLIENVPYWYSLQCILQATIDYDTSMSWKDKPVSKVWEIEEERTIITFPADITFAALSGFLQKVKNILKEGTIEAWLSAGNEKGLPSNLHQKRLHLIVQEGGIICQSEDGVNHKLKTSKNSRLKEVENNYKEIDFEMSTLEDLPSDLIE